MDRKFVLRVLDAKGNTLDKITIDPEQSPREQLLIFDDLRRTSAMAHMRLYISESKNYHAKDIVRIVRAVSMGGFVGKGTGKRIKMPLEWKVVPDTPEMEGINADLVFEPQGERAALTALFNATGGEGWTKKTNWLTDRPLGEWYGVRVNDEGRVWSIHLPENNLCGALPSELFTLPCLKQIVMNGNALTGEIPREIGGCEKMQWIKLNDNQLTGTIPNGIWSLADLRGLDLGGCRLSGSPLPETLGDLRRLQYLHLSHNRIGGTVPESICNLTELIWLRLNNCGLVGTLPARLGNLRKLTLLHFYDNDFTGELPLSLKEIPGLKKISCRGIHFENDWSSEFNKRDRA